MSRVKELVSFDKELIKEFIEEARIGQRNLLVIGLDEVGRGCLAGPVCTGAYAVYASKYDESRLSLAQKSSEEDALLFLDDSKKVTKAQRKDLCGELVEDPNTLCTTDFHSAEMVDENGIVSCIWGSMTENIHKILMEVLKIDLSVDPDDPNNPDSEDFELKIPNKEFNLLILVDGPKTIYEPPKAKKPSKKKPADKEQKSLIDTSNFVRYGLLEANLYESFEPYGLRRIKQVAIKKGDSKSALIAAASNIAKQTRDDYMQDLAKEHPHYSWETNVGYGTAKHRKAIEEHGVTEHHRISFLSEKLDEV